ncbi:MFS transporter [Aeromicrobium sp.]|uniref:MFS transporter n=1 Tax=Aeromicrobium sp. TaxID=1871063 RepID=UPI0025C54B08|nr:MFS transporter [Aeromicrobium sp.]MCK5892578.1 MFS transporter [Aeromicrobium sp.]
MSHVDAPRDLELGAARRRLGFAGAGAAMAAVMLAAGAPGPLHPVYIEAGRVGTAGVTASYGAYLLAVTFAVLVLGRVSDVVGRRPAALASLAGGAAACLVMLDVQSTQALVMGRLVQGVATGMAMTSIGAMVVDLRAPGRHQLASLVTSATPTGAVALGAVASGVAISRIDVPDRTLYTAAIVLTAIAAVGILLAPETVRPPAAPTHRARELARNLRPTITVPSSVRPLFAGAAAAYLAAWTLGGFYQSLGPSLAQSTFPSAGPVFWGLVVASMLGSTVLGGPLTSRLAPRAAGLCGLATFVTGVVGVLLALEWRSGAAFLAASVVAGIGFGASTSGSMRALVARLGGESVAGTLAAIYLVSYTFASIPAFGGGLLIERHGFAAMMPWYAGLVILLAAAAAVVLVTTGRRDAAARQS